MKIRFLFWVLLYFSFSINSLLAVSLLYEDDFWKMTTVEKVKEVIKQKRASETAEQIQQDLNYALFKAVRLNHNPEIIDCLIELGAKLDEEHLFGAAGANNYQIVAKLIDLGLNVNARSSDDQTPLMWTRSIKVAEVLLKHGAEIDAISSCGYTALSLASSDTGVDTEYLEFLVKQGANVNVRVEFAWTPLILASLHHSERPDIFETLIRLGADVNARDFRGRTCFELYPNQFKQVARNDANGF